MSTDFDDIVSQLATVRRWPKDLTIEALSGVLDDTGGSLHRNQAITLAERTGWSTRQLYRWRNQLAANEEGPRPGAPFTEVISEFGASAFHFDDMALTMLYLLGGNMSRFREEVLAAGYPMPSLPTLSRRWRDEVPRHVRDGARHGQVNRHKNLFFVRHSAAAPDEAWQLDAFDLDLRTLLEVDEPDDPADGGSGDDDKREVFRRGARTWVAQRPQLLVLIDDHSRFITAWAMLERTPTAADTCALFADAFEVRPADDGSGVLIGGLPARVVCDNASQFRSVLVEGMIRGFGTQLAPTPAYSPAAKGKVERVGQTIQAGVVTGLAGVASAAERLNGDHALETPAQSWLEFTQVEKLVAAAIYNYNYRQVHATLGVTPFEAYSQRTEPPRTVSDADLAEHYLPVRRKDGKRILHTSGVKFLGEYWLDPTMNPDLIGTEVQVRSLHHRLDRLAIFSNDTFVGMAVRSGTIDKATRDRLVDHRVAVGRAVSRHSKKAREALELRAAAVAAGEDASPLLAAAAALADQSQGAPGGAGPKRRQKAKASRRKPRQQNDTSQVPPARVAASSHEEMEAALDAAATKRAKSARNDGSKESKGGRTPKETT
jgi:transposase InsO family protein